MRKERIINFALVDQVTPFAVPDVYKIKHKWLLWILKKFKAVSQYYGQDVTVKRVVIDVESIFQLIRENLDQMLYRGNTPTLIILGHQQMRELNIEVANIHRCQVDFEFMQSGNRRFMGMEIVLNPFIDGVVLL